jgi:hypothetical protein
LGQRAVFSIDSGRFQSSVPWWADSWGFAALHPRLFSSRAFGAQERGFLDVKQLREAIDQFICAYNAKAAPFEWRQGEIKQQPLRDNIAYFCM